jgi:phosphoglycolate/pyridoxal phosphate phosphatase family enzyme
VREISGVGDASTIAFGADGVDGLVCDLDGVLYRGDRPIEGAAAAVERLRAAGVRILFCTNNSHFTVAQYVQKLERAGVDAAREEILSSAVVTADVLAERGLSGQRALVVGGDGIREALEGVGIVVGRAGPPAVVVVGWDPEFTYDDMRAAAGAVRAGAALVATNADATFPAPDGLWPGAGSILASIERASGASAEVMGKPHPPMMEVAARRLEGASRIAVVGDRPDSDLAGGTARGWTTILVLTGVTREEDVEDVEPRPDYVAQSIASLVPR